MSGNNIFFTVTWTRPAIRKLLSFGNVNHDEVIKQSHYLLEEHPLEQADNIKNPVHPNGYEDLRKKN